MKKKITYQRVTILRRICAMIFDAIILISFFFIILAAICEPIINKTTKYNEYFEEYKTICKATNLYEDAADYSNNIQFITKDYDEKINLFYETNYGKELEETDYSKTWYVSEKELNSVSYSASEEDKEKETSLFIKNEDGTFVENTSESYTTEIANKIKKNRTKFYTEKMQKIANELAKQDEPLKNLIQKLSALTYLSYICALIPSVLLTYLLFPMIFKDRTTLGKKMMQMQVVDARTGQIASRFQIFTRFVIFAVLNVVLSIFTYGLPIVFSIFSVILTKHHSTLHDMAARTYVVCNSYSEATTKGQPNSVIEIVYEDGKLSDPTQEENTSFIEPTDEHSIRVEDTKIDSYKDKK